MQFKKNIHIQLVVLLQFESIKKYINLILLLLDDYLLIKIDFIINK